MKGRHRVASFSGLEATTAAASKVGRANRGCDTSSELVLRAALRGLGLKYRVGHRTLPGHPDIVFPEHRVAVFCDGDFWHGRDWARRRAKLAKGSNSSYWVAKIGGNRARDRHVTRSLKLLGWQVVRVWESEVRGDADRIAHQIAELLAQRRLH
ncbi:MAG: very short patch repair endonuclease [Gammaproteobacteria bacterium]